MGYHAVIQSAVFAGRRQNRRSSDVSAQTARESSTEVFDPVVMEPIPDSEKLPSFEAVMLPHLDAAYNLARWMTRNEDDAQDVVQEAYLRGLRFFDSFTGGNGRGWMLAIVRNTCYSWMRRNRPPESPVLFDENEHVPEREGPNPEAELLLRARYDSLESCLRELPIQFREIIVMRELEGMSYREVAEAAEIPVGTVMSRLARARKRLEQCLVNRAKREAR